MLCTLFSCADTLDYRYKQNSEEDVVMTDTLIDKFEEKIQKVILLKEHNDSVELYNIKLKEVVEEDSNKISSQQHQIDRLVWKLKVSDRNKTEVRLAKEEVMVVTNSERVESIMMELKGIPIPKKDTMWTVKYIVDSNLIYNLSIHEIKQIKKLHDRRIKESTKKN